MSDASIAQRRGHVAAIPMPRDHAHSTYLPEPTADRRGTALCLSGGGFRAVLFHLGALTRLNDAGLLGSVDTIASVSGGSILAAHLVDGVPDWPRPGEVITEWNKRVVAPVLAFVSQDIRTGPLARRWLRPWNAGRTSVPAAGLELAYFTGITQRRLVELPERPRYVFCASDLVFGSLFRFERGVVCGDQVGASRTPESWTVARAVAASSCFPPVFDPIRLRLGDGHFTGGTVDPATTDLVADLRSFEVSDGGVCDNLGLDAVWQDHSRLLVSDGGGVFNVSPDRGALWRLARYRDVQGDQGLRVRKRWLLSNFLLGEMEGAYWGIGSAAQHYPIGDGQQALGYSDRLVDASIATIRTDLDVFDDPEQNVLQNHGYTLADAALRAHLDTSTADLPVPSWPFPEWADEAKVRDALANSSRRLLHGHQSWRAFAGHVIRGR